jgi:hypothetical protein
MTKQSEQTAEFEKWAGTYRDADGMLLDLSKSCDPAFTYMARDTEDCWRAYQAVIASQQVRWQEVANNAVQWQRRVEKAEAELARLKQKEVTNAK